MAKIPRRTLLDDIRRVIAETGGDTRITTYRRLGRHSVSTIFANFLDWDTAIQFAQDPAMDGEVTTTPTIPASQPEQRLPIRHEPGRRKQRTCLYCDRKFLSDGPHNRICGRCANLVERAAPESYSIAYDGLRRFIADL